MTASRSFTRMSPHQIREAAALASRNRRRRGIADRAPVLRAPDVDETPLSMAEVEFGRAQGLIRTDRACAFAGGGR